jgi:hypothetical protein
LFDALAAGMDASADAKFRSQSQTRTCIDAVLHSFQLRNSNGPSLSPYSGSRVFFLVQKFYSTAVRRALLFHEFSEGDGDWSENLKEFSRILKVNFYLTALSLPAFTSLL